MESDGIKNWLTVARELGDRMNKAHNELDKRMYTGVSGGGMVKIQMNGRYGVHSVKIDDNMMDDREVLEDLIAGAINDVIRRIHDDSKAQLSNIADLLPTNNFK